MLSGRAESAPEDAARAVDAPPVKREQRVRRDDLIWDVEPDSSAEEAPRDAREHRIRKVAEQVVRFAANNKLRVPMLPRAATEALTLANDPSVDIRQLDRVVSGDPLIAARVLTVANSPVHGAHSVRNLAQALQRLGTGTIRDILYQAVAEAHIFRGTEGRALEREKEHAVATGHACRIVCRRVGLDSDYAFICGLLHDIGRPVLMDLFRNSPPPQLAPDELLSVVDRLHASFGAHLASVWSLPKLVIEACRRHHVYRDEGRAYSQIGNAVAVADRLSYHHGLGRPVRPVDLARDRTYYDLNLEPGIVQEMLGELERLRRPEAA